MMEEKKPNLAKLAILKPYTLQKMIITENTFVSNPSTPSTNTFPFLCNSQRFLYANHRVKSFQANIFCKFTIYNFLFWFRKKPLNSLKAKFIFYDFLFDYSVH